MDRVQAESFESIAGTVTRRVSSVSLFCVRMERCKGELYVLDEFMDILQITYIYIYTYIIFVIILKR